jgi:hypothetical protein
LRISQEERRPIAACVAPLRWKPRKLGAAQCRAPLPKRSCSQMAANLFATSTGAASATRSEATAPGASPRKSARQRPPVVAGPHQRGRRMVGAAGLRTGAEHKQGVLVRLGQSTT